MKTILITDGTYKNSLAVLRSLGKNNQIDVTSSHSRLLSVGSYSKYSGNFFKIKCNIRDVDKYALELLDILKKKTYDFFLPVGLQAYLAASKYKENFEQVTNLVVPDWKQMLIASNKEQTMDFAKKNGIPIPDTHALDTEKDLQQITTFPVVIKSSDEASKFIRYCNNFSELKERYHELATISQTKIIAQEYVKGFGCGFYGVYNKGALIAHFLHKRLKEFPVTGGPSAVAESYFDNKLYDYGKSLCDKLQWNGPIMAEFKYDANMNTYKLIEMNPKLWGSLDLTIAAGIDVPQLLLQIGSHQPVVKNQGYKYVKYRWMFPDEFKVLVSDLSLKNIKLFLHGEQHTMTNMHLTDPLPTLFQIGRGFIESFPILVKKEQRYPHGAVHQ